MSLMHKYDVCRGITLFKWKQYLVELWYIPNGYTIPEHIHPNEDGKIVYLFGNALIHRRDIRPNGIVQFVYTKLNMFGKCFKVMPYHSHFFSVKGWPLIFLNFQRFHDGHKPTSASVDFIETHSGIKKIDLTNKIFEIEML